MKNKIRAGIYARFSSAKQNDSYSIEAQTDICSEYCKEQGFEIVRIYEEKAYTGTNFSRPQMQQMMHDASDGIFDTIVFHKVDRFGRKSCEGLNVAEHFHKLDIPLIFVYEGLNTSNDKDYCEFVRKIADAEFYSLNLASECRKSLQIRANEGLYNGGNIPLGFKIDNNGYYIRNELTAPIVERIFSLYLNGIPISQIIKDLNTCGYRTQNGNMFTKGAVYSILHNERYCGVYTYNKCSSKSKNTGKRNSHKYKKEYIRIPGMCDEIISVQQFQLVQRKLSENSKPPGYYKCKHDYHYNKLIYCDCGSPMTGSSNHTHGKIYTQYRPTCKCGTASIKLNTA